MRAAIRRLALAGLALASLTAAAETELPAIGDPADQILSPRQEAAIGRRMMAQARERLDLNRDAQVAAYLDALGKRLAAGVTNAPAGGFELFVVHAPSINAFAAPGGYIGVHSGLVLRAETEAQLAAVLAHEISHITQRHIARAYAASQRSGYGTLAAVLAGLILSSENPQAGQAAITTGIAAEQQRRINYTRSNEYEADRIGIRLLADAGYDPAGMAGMFELLQSAGGASASTAPEFLRTHPLSGNRIAEARDRAARMRSEGARHDSLEFHLMRARLRVMEADEPRVLYGRWQGNRASGGEYAAAARDYGLALLELRLGEPNAAIERLGALRADARDNPHYNLAQVAAYCDAGRTDDALELWQDLYALYPESYPVIEAGADLHAGLERPADAVQLVTDYLRRTDDPPAEAWRRLADVAQDAGRSVRSHEALGEYYTRTDRYNRALEQFELAREAAKAGSSNALRLDARIEQVRELQRRRMAAHPASDR